MSQIPPAPHSASRPRANARSRRRRRQLTWSTWLLWPFATVIFGGMPLFVPFVLSTGATPLVADYGGTVAGIGAWAAPAFAKGFDALGVLATLLVAVAAMRGFPGARLPLSDRSDVLIDTLATVSYVTLLLIGTLVVPVLASSPGTASETLLLWVCAWGVMIIALGVGGSMSPREAYLRERARHVRLLHGVPTTSAAPPTRRALVLAVATAVSLPLLTWSACCVAVAVVDGRFWPHVPFLLVLAFGSYLALIGWFVLADRTSRPFDRIAATTLVWLGAAAGAVFTLVLLHAGLWLVGTPLLVFTAAWSAVFLRRRITARAWPFALIQDRLTANGLARQAQRVHDARREWRAELSGSRPCR